MGLQRELAALALRATPLPGQKNFLAESGIATPVPYLTGSIGAVAHEPFKAEELKRLFDLAVTPDLTYYAVFGVPEEHYLSDQRESYEPVRMRGKMYFRPVAERMTLAWGGLCPDTPDGQRLFNSILDAMTPLYQR